MTTLAHRWLLANRLRFARAEDGVAAVEFALIAAPFFFMLFAVIEVALLFFLGATLENATIETSRAIRTGRFQADGGGAEQFRQAVCDRGVLLDCTKLSVDVRTYETFNAVNLGAPIDEDGELDTADFDFDAGAGGQIVLVRVFYDWKLVTPQMGQGLSNMSGNRRLLSSAVAFRNEPF